MRKKSMPWAAFVGAAIAVLAITGCNIFEPFAPKRASGLDYRGLIIRGNDALNRGDYVAAEEYYLRAQRKNSRGSEAYLFYAQSIVARYKLDFKKLKLEFECKRDTRVLATCLAEKIDTTGVPFINPRTTLGGIDSIFYPVAMAVNQLNYILRTQDKPILLEGGYQLPPDSGQASDGVVSPGVARLDLGLLLAINGMLAALDLDGDLRIDANCGDNITHAIPAVQDSLRRMRCSDGALSEQNRLNNFIKLTESVKIDNLDSKDVRARNMSTDPNDINRFIESMQIPIAGSVYNLDSVDRTLQRHEEAKLSGEISGVVNNVKDLNNFLNYMRYNDSLDNDFDGQARGTKAPMLWHNFDRDIDPNSKNHGIRYDYNDATNFGIYPLESGDIGHPVHRFLHANLYYTFDSLGKVFPALAADTATLGVPTKNSRFGLMRKKCHEIVDGAVASSGVAQNKAALDLLCNTIAPVFLPSIRPNSPGSGLSDWVGGSAGVDEELIDEFDNDYDGIKDEDARNLKGYDDDDDAQLEMDMRGSTVAVMAWQDDANHVNRCIDIDIARPMNRDGLVGSWEVDSLLKRQNCVGTLEHRLYLAKQSLTIPSYLDSLIAFYSAVGSPNNPADTGKNCMDDYRRKLPLSYKTALSITDAVANVACRFKHIWIAPRPPRSEWSGGVFGLDEERYDCVDNDGDGWIDEDLDNRRSGPCWSP